MSRDRSLDEFFSTSDDEETASTPETEPDTETEAKDGADEESESATTTNDEEPEESEAANAEEVEGAEAADVDVDDRTDADEHHGDPEPPRATYRWSPEGDACPECGAVVEQRWRDGGRFVCADCKEW